MTLPGKLEPGLKGFPTPNETPDEQAYLVFYFPDSNDWAGILLGALTPLTFAYNWYQWGEALPEETALVWAQIIQEAPYNVIPRNIPAPYWDTDEDVDDDEPRETQEWYGYVTDPEAPPDELTFVENVAIWAFTGFVAFATLEVGAAPAIFFHTLAKRWVMAFKRGSIGEVIRVLVDGVEYGRVDTSSASEGEIVEVRVMPPDDDEPHDIMLIQVS